MPLKPKHERLAATRRARAAARQRVGHYDGPPVGQPPAERPSRHRVAATMPGTLKRATRYTKAVARWIAAGQPTRSQDEIDALLAICQGCEHFNASASACAKCGCNINSQRSALANKLAMATEKCPLGKW